MTRSHRIAIAAARLVATARKALSRESGIALPTATILLVAVTSLGAVAVKEVISSQDQTRLDRSVKRAIDAADAGFDAAVYRLNKLQPGATQCVVVNPGSGSMGVGNSGSDGWCPAVEENLGDDASYSYRMSRATSVSSNGQSLLQRKVVSTGIIGFGGNREARRRTLSVVSANTGNPLVGNYAVISEDSPDLQGQAQITGDLGTNGTVRLQGSTSVCGDIVYGKNKTPEDGYSAQPGAGQGQNCLSGNYQNQPGPYPAPQDFILGPVEQGCVKLSPPCISNSQIPDQYWKDDNRNTRVLEIEAGDTLTLTGDNYSFCYVWMKGGRIIIGSRLPTQPPMRWYVDAPQNCTTGLPVGGPHPNADDRGDFKMETTSEITNLNADPATLILFLVGNPNILTQATFAQTVAAQVAMVVYGPYSECTIDNQARIRGAVACKKVVMRNQAKVTWDPLVGALTMNNIVPLYRRTSYVECDRVNGTPSPPDASCS
jgi:Tfp pilus assembly protein PilX